MMKTRILIAVTVSAICGVSVSRAQKSSKPQLLPTCTVRLTLGTPCVWRGVQALGIEVSPTPVPNPSMTPLPDPSSFPSEFRVPAGDVVAAWGRAQSFVAQHSSMKIQTVSDYLIETYNPGAMGQYGFRVVKTPARGDFTIKVTCLSTFAEIIQRGIRLEPQFREDVARARDLERRASFYIATGVMPEGSE